MIRRGRNGLLVAVALTATVAAVWSAVGSGDGDQVVAPVGPVGPVEDGAVSVEELTGDRWVATAYSAVVVPPDPPAFLQFDEGGWVGGIDGCDIIDGEWELDGDRLLVSLAETEDVPCTDGSSGLAELLEADPTVGRFDDADGTLQLTAGEDFVTFQRFDRLGAEPTAALVEGTWTAGSDDHAVTFDLDGTGSVQVLECSQAFEWSLDGDALDIDGIDRNGIPCNGGVVGGGLQLPLASSPRVRIDDTLLWISSDLGVGLVRSTEP